MAVRSSSVPSSTISRVTAEFGVRSDAWRGAVLRRERRVFTKGMKAVGELWSPGEEREEEKPPRLWLEREVVTEVEEVEVFNG